MPPSHDMSHCKTLFRPGRTISVLVFDARASSDDQAVCAVELFFFFYN